MRAMIAAVVVVLAGCGVSSNAYDASGPELGQVCPANEHHLVCSPDGGEIWCCSKGAETLSVCQVCGGLRCVVDPGEAGAGCYH